MLHLLYNIRGVVSRNVIQCYIGWGVVKIFQFLRYIICARPHGTLALTRDSNQEPPGPQSRVVTTIILPLFQGSPVFLHEFLWKSLAR